MNLIKNLAEHLEGDKAIDHAELTKFNAKLENIRLAACALSDLLQRINSPARGDAAQIEWMFKELDAMTGMCDTPEPSNFSSHYPVQIDPREGNAARISDPTHASDSIGYAMMRTMVSREQLEEKYPRHNHVTRDMKPPGECPSCDLYYKNHEEIMGKPSKYAVKEPPRHCNFCWKETETRQGDCVDCGFSKVPKQATPIHFDYGEMEQRVAAKEAEFNPKKWLGGET